MYYDNHSITKKKLTVPYSNTTTVQFKQLKHGL